MGSQTKVVAGIVCTWMVAIVLIMNSHSPVAPATASGASEAIALALSASPFALQRVTQQGLRGRSMQDKLKMYGIGSSPLERLAITAIEANSRPGVAMRASEVPTEVASEALNVEEKKWLDKVMEDVKYKESLMAGVTEPMGYFDPLGFSTTVPDAGKLLFYREVELKHGRVAMLAALGMLVGEQFHPLFGGNINVPAAFAFQETPLQTFWPAVVAAIAIPEIYSVFTFKEPGLKGADQWTIREDHEPGNLGFDPLGLKPTDPKELKEMQTKELNNGRLAMIAAAGMIAQELATGKTLF